MVGYQKLAHETLVQLLLSNSFKTVMSAYVGCELLTRRHGNDRVFFVLSNKRACSVSKRSRRGE